MPILSIDIEAKYAQFQDAMQSIERTAKRSATNLKGAFSSVNTTLAGLGVTVSAGALAAIVKSAIDAADHLNDLSKKTGVAVEVLGGIGFAAAQAGSSLDGVSGALTKLNKSIADAGSGNKEALESFRLLGITVEDGNGKLKTADKILVELAGAYEQFADGPEKAAIAQRQFGKSYQEVLPLLDDGAEALRKNIEYYQAYAGVTSEVAQQADQFNDTLEKIKLISGAAGQQIAAELLPTLQVLSEQMLEVKESAGGFGAVGSAIRTVIEAISVLGLETKFTFKTIGEEIGGTAAQLAALARLDFKGFSSIADDMAESARKAREENDKLIQDILNPKPRSTSQNLPSEITDALEGQKPVAPRLASTGPDPAAAQLAAQLREFERQFEREGELLSTRNEFLQEYYQQDLISIRDYYAGRAAAASEALAAQEANIDKEIALLRSRRGKDAAEQAQNESKIKDLIDRKAQLQQKAGADAIRAINEEIEANRQLINALQDVNTELLEQQGLFSDAAARRFDERNRSLRQRLETELASAQERGDSPAATQAQRGLNQINALRGIAVAQGRLNELQDAGQRIQSDLAIATERAGIAAESGVITELESMRQISDARAQAVVDLQAVADKYAQMAAQTGNPAIVQRAKELQVEVERLAASADLVRERFQGVFQSGFESFFDKLTSGTASVRDTFKAMFSEISSEINRIAAQNLSKALFGKEGPLGGVVDIFSQMFGGKGKSPVSAVSDAAGVASETAARTANVAALTSMTAVTTTTDASLVALAATTVSVDTSLVALAASAASAATALAAAAAAAGASAASSSSSSFIGLFSNFASTAANGNAYLSGNVIPFAKGGIPGVIDSPTMFAMSGGRTGLMGEAGPEAIMPLLRDKHGQLAVRMLSDRGVVASLPLARDPAGRLAVRARNDSVIHKFASGGVFGAQPTFRTNASMAMDRSMTLTPGSTTASTTEVVSHGDTYNVKVEIPPGGSRDSGDQFAARTVMALQRASRRNG